MQSGLVVIPALCVAFALLPITPAVRCHYGERISAEALPKNRTKGCPENTCGLTVFQMNDLYVYKCGTPEKCGTLVNKCRILFMDPSNATVLGAKCCCTGELCNGGDNVLEAARRVQNATGPPEVELA